MGNNIIWTAHSLERLRERGIDKENIERVIKEPVGIIDENNNKYKCFSEIYDNEPKYLIVVYTKSNVCINVITAFRTSRGGIKAHGFKI